jgi:hypothetical protein
MVLYRCYTECLEEEKDIKQRTGNHTRYLMDLHQSAGCRNELAKFLQQQRTTPFKSGEPCSVTHHEVTKRYVKDGTALCIHIQ